MMKTKKAVVMGSIKLDVEFVPEVNNEQMAMLEANMKFNEFVNLRQIDLIDDFGNKFGSLTVNLSNFDWEEFI